MIPKRILMLLSGILLIFEGISMDVKESGVDAFLHPKNDKITSRFVLDKGESEGFFAIEGDGIISLIPAPSYTKYNDDMKTSIELYSSTFSFEDVNYLTTYSHVSSYKADFDEKKNKVVYYRSDKSLLEEDPRPIFLINLNKEECQKAYEEGNLTQYFQDKNISLIPIINHESMKEALFMASVYAITSGDRNMEALSSLQKQISEALKKEKEDMQDFFVTGTYDQCYCSNSGKIQAFLEITYRNLWSTRIAVEEPFSVKKFSDMAKVQEIYHLSGFSIEGESYVFFKKDKLSYKLKEFRKTIEPTENPNVFYEVSTPVYTIGYGKDERVLSGEALRILNKRESSEISTENGLLCLGHSAWRSAKDKEPQHTLRQCQKKHIVC